MPADGVEAANTAHAQSLLEDRFQLVIRRETKELSVYELKLAKTGGQLGPNLKRSAIVNCPVEAAVVGTIPCGGFVLDRGRLVEAARISCRP